MAKDVSTGPPSARDGNEGERDLHCRLLLNNPAKYSILIVDDAGIIVTWSEGARTLYGYSEDEIEQEAKPIPMHRREMIDRMDKIERPEKCNDCEQYKRCVCQCQ